MIGIKAKMLALALLALLDVVADKATMADIAVEKVGPLGTYAGKMRLRFTVFGNPTRLMDTASEIAQCSDLRQMEDLFDAAMARDEKLRLALKMIAAWNEIAQRLLDERLLDSGGLKRITDGT